ncbi:uncharacterized protein LOC126996096 [Eriocheir sinensis]|uniref:uncharacterized protein LOC126996096 n=1 Tax=Eriocheir sinensis TaxID=95602 RepID=UPI0021C57404|nr:uncharacterized protein LOC126996096 [Eriocheir sinensis]
MAGQRQGVAAYISRPLCRVGPVFGGAAGMGGGDGCCSITNPAGSPQERKVRPAIRHCPAAVHRPSVEEGRRGSAAVGHILGARRGPDIYHGGVNMRLSAAACVWAAVMVGAAVVQGWVTADEGERLWLRVLVEKSWFTNFVERKSQQLSSVTLCGAACMRHDWCHLWCRAAPTHCLLTSLIVSGSYQPTSLQDVLTCYTSRGPEMAFGSGITSSPPRDAIRVKENLVDGVFRGDVRNCAIVERDNSSNPWFLVDLRVDRLVSKVVLKAQPTDLAEIRMSGIEVKVGDVEEAGDFTSYTLLGTFNDSLVAGQEVALLPPAPVRGRYVSIQRTNIRQMQIAHLEIF